MDADDPTLSEHERLIVRALHSAAATERAPAQLRERIEAERERAAARSRSGVLGSFGSLGPRIVSGAAAVTVAAVIAVVLLLTGGTSGTPTLASAAALASRGATDSAPAADPMARYQLAARVGSLHFPNWEAQHTGWSATGSRTDTLGNRTVKTVYYENRGHEIAYSIVSSPIIRAGQSVTISSHGRTVFVWTARGHTCLLSGGTVSAATLRGLVAHTHAG